MCQFRAETRVDRLLASPDVEVVSNSEDEIKADETESDLDCGGPPEPPELRESAEARANSGIKVEVSY